MNSNVYFMSENKRYISCLTMALNGTQLKKDDLGSSKDEEPSTAEHLRRKKEGLGSAVKTSTVKHPCSMIKTATFKNVW